MSERARGHLAPPRPTPPAPRRLTPPPRLSNRRSRTSDLQKDHASKLEYQVDELNRIVGSKKAQIDFLEDKMGNLKESYGVRIHPPRISLLSTPWTTDAREHSRRPRSLFAGEAVPSSGQNQRSRAGPAKVQALGRAGQSQVLGQAPAGNCRSQRDGWKPRALQDHSGKPRPPPPLPLCS